MTSTPTPAEQIDEILAKLLVDYTTGIKFPPNSAATISVPSLKLQEAKAQLSKLLIRERLEERKAAALHQQVYTEDEFTLAKESGLLYPEDEQCIATLEQQLNEESES